MTKLRAAAIPLLAGIGGYLDATVQYQGLAGMIVTGNPAGGDYIAPGQMYARIRRSRMWRTNAYNGVLDKSASIRILKGACCRWMFRLPNRGRWCSSDAGWR